MFRQSYLCGSVGGTLMPCLYLQSWLVEHTCLEHAFALPLLLWDKQTSAMNDRQQWQDNLVFASGCCWKGKRKTVWNNKLPLLLQLLVTTIWSFLLSKISSTGTTRNQLIISYRYSWQLLIQRGAGALNTSLWQWLFGAFSKLLF